MVSAEIRRGEWGSPFPTELVRDFIHTALRHSASADMVSEYVFDIATSDEEPADIGEALRIAIGEVLSAATREDWMQVGRDLLSDALDTIREDPPPAAPPPHEESIPAAWWALPSGPQRSRRKAPVKVEQEAILAWLAEVGSATQREIAEHFGISEGTVYMKGDGLVAQDKLEVTPGIRAERGRPRRERRYSVPRPPDPPAEGAGADALGAREESPTRSTCPSSGIELDVSTHPTNTPEARSRYMTTEEQHADIAVGEKYGEELWRIKEVETGSVLRDAITSEREYLWLLDTFNHGDDYANEQQARRDAAASAGA